VIVVVAERDRRGRRLTAVGGDVRSAPVSLSRRSDFELVEPLRSNAIFSIAGAIRSPPPYAIGSSESPISSSKFATTVATS